MRRPLHRLPSIPASRRRRPPKNLGAALALLLGLVGCGDDATPAADAGSGGRDGGTQVRQDATVTPTDAGGPVDSGPRPDVPTPGDDLPPAGNPAAPCPIPGEGDLEDVSSPDQVVGTGNPESCTSAAFVSAVAQGGVITFNCGAEPVTIELDETARIFNNTGPRIVIDGGGLVTLSGRGERRILYMNTCDEAQVWTTAHCQNQDHPQLTVQNLTFVDGNATSHGEDLEGGGGAIFARGGRLKIVRSRFFRNTCAPTGQDVGGAAVRALSQFNDLPVYVTESTFGGRDDLGNSGSNGGATSSIGVNWVFTNSVLSNNRALGNGGNPADPGTPGGGSGGAIYMDGATLNLQVCGSILQGNNVNAFGSAIFFVTNTHDGDILIDRSTITGNTGGSWYEIAPQISGHSDTRFENRDSTIEF